MKKIVVLGSPGSGKTTFATRLHEKTGIPLYHLDLIWHKPDRTTVSREEFDTKLSEIMSTPTWIIDGNYNRTAEIRIISADTVFLFDLPVEVCLDGARSRIGKKRPDMPWIEETFDEEFKNWITDFPKIQLPQLYEHIKKHKENKNIIIFKSRDEADDYLNRLR
ncbi:MAG: adenylate kinase [Clostridia bacterium]|nr:adenylate kinase [Clostridia bacterium]